MSPRLASLITAVVCGACTPTEDLPAGTCGDGVVDPGEACDADGDACDADCHLTGATAWTVTRDDNFVAGIAVAPDGTIILLASTFVPHETDSLWLLALDPAGQQRWQAPVVLEDGFTTAWLHVATDDDGWIYVQGGGLQRYSPQGELAWTVIPTDIEQTAFAVAGDAIYTAGLVETGETGDHLFVGKLGLERRAAATGALVWRSAVGDDESLIDTRDLAVAGDTVVVVGHQLSSVAAGGAARVAFDAATGAPGPLVRGPDEFWHSVAALPSGELALVGWTAGAPFIRKIGADGETLWTVPFEREGTAADGPGDLTVGPDGSIVVLVEGDLEDGASEAGVRSYGDDGQLLWNTVYPPLDPASQAITVAAAFGPGFLAVAGEDVSPTGATLWIRRIGPN